VVEQNIEQDNGEQSPEPKPLMLPKGALVEVVSLWQEEDCCDGGSGQQLDVLFPDGGGGCFIAFKTERWAFDDANALREMADFCEAVMAHNAAVGAKSEASA